MLDHISITVSELDAAERFYDAIMRALGVVKVGRRYNWLGYGERARADHPDRVYIAIYTGPKPEAGSSRHWCFKAKSRAEVDAFWNAGIAAVAAMTVGPGCATIIHPITPRSSGIPTATGSRRSATTRCKRADMPAHVPGSGVSITSRIDPTPWRSRRVALSSADRPNATSERPVTS